MNETARPRVEDRMIRAPEVAHVADTLAATAERMAVAGLDALPVVDGDELLGMIDRRQIERHARQGMALGAVVVRDVVGPGTFHCFAEQDGAEVAAAMAALEVEHLPVLDGDKALVGIVARRDLPPPEGSAKARFSTADGGAAARDPHPGLKVYSEKPKLKE